MAEPDYTAEIWRTIERAPGYEISNCGRVRRIEKSPQGTYRAGRISRPHAKKTGHLKVCLTHLGVTKRVAVHRLVCIAFNGPPPDPRLHAAHKDGNPANNTPDNLYWATPKQNTADSIRHGTFNANGPRLHPERVHRGDQHWTRRHPERLIRGEQCYFAKPEHIKRGALNSQAKLSECSVREILNSPTLSGSALAKRFGVSQGLISQIRKGRIWKHISGL